MVDVKVFDGMSVSDVEKFVKETLKPYIKERKASEKNAEIENIKSQLEEGMVVTVKYKDGEITGTVVAMREKTFSLLTEEVLNLKGEPSRISRGYNFVTLIEETTEEDSFEEDSVEEGSVEEGSVEEDSFEEDSVEEVAI